MEHNSTKKNIYIRKINSTKTVVRSEKQRSSQESGRLMSETYRMNIKNLLGENKEDDRISKQGSKSNRG